MKFKMFLILLASLIGTTTPIIASKFTAEDYKHALWMVTRFYGGQRSGEGPNWLLIGHDVGSYTDGSSFTKDADGSYDLTGGWFDCGDHVKFGQTQYYAGYALLKAYEAFPEGFEDKYSADYSGYVNKDAWGYDDGTPNGIPDVIDEAKYAIEYFMKCARDENTFYSQVGNGDYDHKEWVTSAKMSTLSTSNGGESDGSRAIKKNTSGAAAMSAEAAAAMALYANLSQKYSFDSQDFIDQVKAKAIIAYKYSKKQSSTTGSISGSYYQAKPDKSMNAAKAFAAAELYKLTGNDSYKNDATNINLDDQYWVLGYNDTQDLAYYTLGKEGISSKAKNQYDKTIDSYESHVDGNGIFNYGDRTWGPIRYNASAAFSVSLYDNMNNNTSNINWVKKQIDFILGDNNANFSYLTGFDREGVSSPKHPHHRNLYLNDKNVADKNALTIPEKNKYIGVMVGGNDNDPGSYKDDLDNYYGSEGGIDYNVGLLGALAYLVANTDPNEPPDATTDSKVISNKLSISAYPNPFNPIVNLNITLNTVGAKSVNIYNIKGEIIKSFNAKILSKGNNSLSWNASKLSSGIYFLKVATQNEVASKKLVLLK